MNTFLELLHLDLKLATNNPGGLSGDGGKPIHLLHMIWFHFEIAFLLYIVF